MKKFFFYIILCCLWMLSCHPKAEKDRTDYTEKCDLNLSLSLGFSRWIPCVRPFDTTGGLKSNGVIYSINIIDDSVIVNDHRITGNGEYRGKLTYDQCSELNRMISALTQIYDNNDRIIPALTQIYDNNNLWSMRWRNQEREPLCCILKIDDHMYYRDHNFTLSLERQIEYQRQGPQKVFGSSYRGEYQPPPEEVQLLIDYILNLSSIPDLEEDKNLQDIIKVEFGDQFVLSWDRVDHRIVRDENYFAVLEDRNNFRRMANFITNEEIVSNYVCEKESPLKKGDIALLFLLRNGLACIGHRYNSFTFPCLSPNFLLDNVERNRILFFQRTMDCLDEKGIPR